MTVRFLVAFAVTLAILSAAVVATELVAHDPEHARPPHAAPADARVQTGTFPLAVDGADVGGTQQTVIALTAWVSAQIEQQREVDAYLAAVEAQRVEDAAAALRQRAAPTGDRTQPSAAPVNNGAHSDAWWHGVSICEQGGRNDPYYGYFSIMDGSAGGRDWATQVAMANAIIARAGDRAWAASCVAAGYAASPSG